MLYLLNLPFVGKGEPKLKKIMSLTRKEERDLMKEVTSAPPGIYIDESDSKEDPTKPNCPSCKTPTSDLSDWSSIDTISDGKSLHGRSLAGYMMILKGYTLLKQTLGSLPRNPEKMQSRKMQHHFTQAYKQTKPSESLSTTSMTLQMIHAPEPSVGRHPLSSAMAHLNIFDSKPAVTAPFSSRFTERADTIHPNPAALGKRILENERPVDSDDGKEKMDSNGVSHFFRKCSPLTPTSPGDGNTSSVSEERFISGILKSNISPYTPVVDCNGLHSLSMERPEQSPECVISEGASKSDERHVPSLSTLVPPLPLSISTPFSTMHGINLLANGVFPGTAFNSNPFALQSFLERIPLAWPSASISSGPSLGCTLCNGFNANLTSPAAGPYNYDLLAASMTTPFVIDPVIQINRDQDTEMVAAEVAFEHERALRSTTTATQCVNTYEHPTISVVGISAIPGPYETHYSAAGVEAFVTQSVSVSGSQGSSSNVESDLSALPMTVSELPAELSGSTFAHPCLVPLEIPLVERHAYKTNTKGILTNAENEKDTQNTLSTNPKVEVCVPVASGSPPALDNGILPETSVQPVGYDNCVTTPVRRMPEYIAPSSENHDDGETRPDDDAMTEPDVNNYVNESDVNADILVHAILNLPLPPSVVASIQVLGERKRRNSNCREGISKMRARQRQKNVDENREDDTLRQRTRLNHSSRLSPYGSVTRWRKGNAKGHDRWGDNPSGSTHSLPGTQSSANIQTSGVESGNNVRSRSPFNSSNNGRHISTLQDTEDTKSQPRHGYSTIPSPSLRRSREDDLNADGSGPEKNGSVKRTRFRGSAEELEVSANSPHRPLPRKKPSILRRAFGFGSAGRGGLHHPINGGMQMRTNEVAATRRARYASSTPASRHLEEAQIKFEYRHVLAEKGDKTELAHISRALKAAG